MLIVFDHQDACGRVVAIEDGLVKVTLEARRRGAGPASLNLDNEQTAIVGEADLEIPAT
jgi:hypothetical protein